MPAGEPACLYEDARTDGRTVPSPERFRDAKRIHLRAAVQGSGRHQLDRLTWADRNSSCSSSLGIELPREGRWFAVCHSRCSGHLNTVDAGIHVKETRGFLSFVSLIECQLGLPRSVADGVHPGARASCPPTYAQHGGLDIPHDPLGAVDFSRQAFGGLPVRRRCSRREAMLDPKGRAARLGAFSGRTFGPRRQGLPRRNPREPTRLGRSL